MEIIIMDGTQPRVPLTAAAWVVIAVGPVPSGTISPATQSIRLSISDIGAPSDLKQGHLRYAHSITPFLLVAGETLYAIAESTDTSAIVTYGAAGGFIEGNGSDSQNPVSSDAGSVFAKDIWIEESDIFNFSGSVTDLFDNLHSTITDVTSNNPKEIFIHFERTVISNAMGLGTTAGDFSNVEIQIGNSGGIFTTVVDESASGIKYTSRTFQLPVTPGFNAIKLIFHTADQVSLSNVVILKTASNISRLQAVSEASGLVEDITSFSGALNVTDGLVHKLFVNRYMEADGAIATTLAIAANALDRVLNVDDATGIVAGNIVEIRTNGPGTASEISLVVISVLVNAITVNRPIDNGYAIGATVTQVVQNMAVNGLITPQSFRVTPPPSGSRSVFQITRFIISMTHAGVPDDGKFGGIGALTNGVLVRAFFDNAFGTSTMWFTNGDMKTDMFNIDYSDKAPAGENGTSGRWTITEAGAVFEMDGENLEYLEILVQDDLSALTTFRIKVQGRVFGE